MEYINVDHIHMLLNALEESLVEDELVVSDFPVEEVLVTVNQLMVLAEEHNEGTYLKADEDELYE